MLYLITEVIKAIKSISILNRALAFIRTENGGRIRYLYVKLLINGEL